MLSHALTCVSVAVQISPDCQLRRGGRGGEGKSVHEQEGRREEEEAQGGREGGREGECEIVLSCLPYLN